MQPSVDSAAAQFQRQYASLFDAQPPDRKQLGYQEQQWSLPPAGEYRPRTLLRDRRVEQTQPERKDKFRIRTGETAARGSGRDGRIFRIANLGAEEVGKDQRDGKNRVNEAYSRGRSLDSAAAAPPVGNRDRIENQNLEQPGRVPSAVGRRLRLGQLAESNMARIFQTVAPAGKASPQHARNSHIGLINQSLDLSPIPSFAPRKKPHPRKEELMGHPVRDIFKMKDNVPNVNLRGINPASILEEHPKLLNYYMKHREPRGTYNTLEEQDEKRREEEFKKKKSLEKLTTKMASLADPFYGHHNAPVNSPSAGRPNYPTRDELTYSSLNHPQQRPAPYSERIASQQQQNPPFPQDTNIEVPSLSNAAFELPAAVSLQVAVVRALEAIRTGKPIDKSKVLVAIMKAVRECPAVRRIVGLDFQEGELQGRLGNARNQAPVGYAYGMVERMSERAHSEAEAKARLGSMIYQVFTDHQLIEILQEMLQTEDHAATIVNEVGKQMSPVKELIGHVEKRVLATMIGRRTKEQRLHRKVFRD
jgi:hypothetical protein